MERLILHMPLTSGHLVSKPCHPHAAINTKSCLLDHLNLRSSSLLNGSDKNCHRILARSCKLLFMLFIKINDLGFRPPKVQKSWRQTLLTGSTHFPTSYSRHWHIEILNEDKYSVFDTAHLCCSFRSSHALQTQLKRNASS